MTTNPIRYTSRTFTTILNDINSDPYLIDKPEWFKRIWAGVGDMLSMIENASANQSFLRTAFTRQAVIDLCEQIDYDLSPRIESSGEILFYIKGTASFPFTIARVDLAGRTVASVSVASKKYEARGNKTVSAINETFTADAGTDKLTVARVYVTGEKVRLTTTGTIPSPFALSTDYYVIYVDSTHIRLASSLSNAYSGSYIDISTTGSGIHTIHLYSVSVTCYQQESIASSVVIGTSDGTSLWQEFSLPNSWVLKDTLSISINSITWTRIDSFINSSGSDTHFKLLYDKDGKGKVRFGNGTYGAIPGSFDIYANYAYGGGVDSNVSVANKITLYAGSDINIEGCSNPSTFTGGSNEETIENAKRIAPILLKARDRFVTVEDGEALALSYGGVKKVGIIKNYYGILSVKVAVVPAGGGAPSSTLKTGLKSYLIERTILEEIDVRVEDPTYYTMNVTSAMKMKEGYVFSDVLPFYRLAVRLLCSEVTAEIVELYQSTGIDDAVSFINNKWSTSFTDEDYPQIQKLIEEIYNQELIPDFGGRYDESEVLGYLQMYVDGCEYCTWTLPSLPLTLNDDEIATDGTMTLTEIP